MNPADDDLECTLQSLDQLLERAVSAAQRAGESTTVQDRFRGLYVGSDEVHELLARRPGQLPPWRDRLEPVSMVPAADDSAPGRLSWLAQAFDLDAFDSAVLVVALAPDLDLRYERVYAYLQDDVTRRRPTVDLTLNLLCESATAKRARLRHFQSDAPLVRHGVLTLVADANTPHAPLLAHALKVDDQILDVVTGNRGLDVRLTPFCELVPPTSGLDDVPIDDGVRRSLRALLLWTAQNAEPLRVYFSGADSFAKRRTAEAIAAERGARLLAVDCRRVSVADGDRLAGLIFRDAYIRGAVVLLEHVDAPADDRTERLRPWLRAAMRHSCATIFAGRRSGQSGELDAAWRPAGFPEIAFDMPGHAERRSWWRRCLSEYDVALDSAAVESLASRFHLTAAQIADATATVKSRVVCERASSGTPPPAACAATPTLGDFFASARAQCVLDAGPSVRKIKPVHGWADIILPRDAQQQLRELCARVTHRQLVLGDWGFHRKLSTGRGITALFAGTTGTGKTMAAEIIATELGLDLYKIDLAGVVSKYIGETEKNLDKVFAAAEHANAILFFDEADALFGKRSEIRDSHDRYANVEISYLLQRMDAYEGVAILATNLRENMDEAFVRRLQFAIEFPFPDEAQRLDLWRALFPPETPRDIGLDFDFLAKQFRLTGGHIKNIVLGASYLAASNGGRIEMKHLVTATWRECEKMGRAITAEDFGRYAENLP